MQKNQQELEVKDIVGIVAGNGNYPLQVAQELSLQGKRCFAICHKGETSSAIEKYAEKVIWLKVGQLGKIFDFFKQNQVTQCVFAGGIKRVRFLGGVALDARSMALLAKLTYWRDDALLRRIAEEFEKEGIAVISGARILKAAFIEQGQIAGPELSEELKRDMRLGVELSQKLGLLDIGQSLVLSQGTVIAVEAIEGTDAMLKRAGSILKGAPSVVVKFAKVAQDERIDLPTIGPTTLKIMNKCGLKALVIEAQKTIVLDLEEVKERASKWNISLYALNFSNPSF